MIAVLHIIVLSLIIYFAYLYRKVKMSEKFYFESYHNEREKHYQTKKNLTESMRKSIELELLIPEKYAEYVMTKANKQSTREDL